MGKSTVEIGDKVKVILNGAVQELEIVELPEQVNPAKGKISFLSPVAKAILGQRYPARVVVKAPDGKLIDCRLLKVAL